MSLLQADGEFEDCSHNFGDLCENRTEEQVKAATDRVCCVYTALSSALPATQCRIS